MSADHYGREPGVTRVDLVRLAALAAAATKGPWTDSFQSVMAGDEYVVEAVQDVHTARKWPSEDDAEFIAACHPGVVAALVEAVQAARAVIEASPWGQVAKWTERRDALSAALAVFGDESPQPFEARPAVEPPGRAGGGQP